MSVWWTTLPVPVRLTLAKVPDVPHQTLPNLLLIHIVYHQCLCALHSSIVPLFCWGAADGSWISARQTSAQVAYEHAGAASELIEAVLSSSHKLSAIPSFVGYAAYCGCAIQIPFTFSGTEAVRLRAQNNVKANFRMIQALAKYWKFTSLLVWAKKVAENNVEANIKLHRNPTYAASTRFMRSTTQSWKTNPSCLTRTSLSTSESMRSMLDSPSSDIMTFCGEMAMSSLERPKKSSILVSRTM